MIIAFDFDGVLVHNAYPAVGAPNPQMIEYCKRIQELGVETILWTSRMDKELQDAINFCEEWGLNFTTINEAAPSNVAQFAHEYGGRLPTKVYADVYIDDRMIGYDELTALQWLYRTVEELESRREYKNE